MEVPQRAKAAALLEALNASAAASSQCDHGARALVPGARYAARSPVLAQLVHGGVKAPSSDQRHRLAVDLEEPVRHRHVRLACAGRVLSQADNWYVPGRLTPAMNQILDRSDTPFGRAVRNMPFRRQVLAVERLWVTTASPPPSWVLRHRALLIRADGAPISEVLETYSRDALFLEEHRS